MGIETAAMAIMAAAAAANAHKQNIASKDAKSAAKEQTRLAEEQAAQAEAMATQAETRAKQSQVAPAMQAQRDTARARPTASATLLTGPQGVDSSSLSLGRQTLLGS